MGFQTSISTLLDAARAVPELDQIIMLPANKTKTEIFSSLKVGESVGDYTINWREDSYRTFILALGSAVASTDVGFLVSDGAAIGSNDMIRVIGASGAGGTVGDGSEAILKVTNVSGNWVAVTSMTGCPTLAGMSGTAAQVTLEIVGNCQGDMQDWAAAVHSAVSSAKNYIERISTPMKFTENVYKAYVDCIAAGNYTGAGQTAYAKEVAKKMVEHAILCEKAMIYGIPVAPASGAQGGGMMGGFRYFFSAGGMHYDLAAAALTGGHIDDIVGSCVAAGLDLKNAVCFGNYIGLKALGRIANGKTVTVQDGSANRFTGVRVTGYQNIFGEIPMILDPNMTNGTKGEVFIMQKDLVSLHPLNKTDKKGRLLTYVPRGNYIEQDIISEFTIKVKNSSMGIWMGDFT